MKPSAKSAAARPSPPDDYPSEEDPRKNTSAPARPGLLADWATEQELAAELNKHPRTVARWRELRIGPPVWRHWIYLVLQHASTAELYTFATSSMTGRRAVGNLLRHFDRTRRTHPDELPVIKLKIGGFQHRDERIGWVATPVLTTL